METIRNERKLCICCMEEHDVSIVRLRECDEFKNESLEYFATYEYCDRADEYIATEEMISKNDIALKNSYREKVGLLTTQEIEAIRRKYGISQTDLSILLGWGAKTITRYESHQVQDVAHDTILRKIDCDPEWFLSFLENSKENISEAAYNKYKATALGHFEASRDSYLRKSIYAKYAMFSGDLSCCGGVKLNIDKLIDVINYFANAQTVTNLFKVKLMKMLWYSDALSFKRFGKSITGLAYSALPMGAVPVAHELIISLKGLNCQETYVDEHLAYSFLPTPCEYPSLSEQDIDVLDKVICEFGSFSRKQLVDRMHKEQAYIETAANDVIQYQYAKQLSLE